MINSLTPPLTPTHTLTHTLTHKLKPVRQDRGCDRDHGARGSWPEPRLRVHPESRNLKPEPQNLHESRIPRHTRIPNPESQNSPEIDKSKPTRTRQTTRGCLVRERETDDRDHGARGSWPQPRLRVHDPRNPKPESYRGTSLIRNTPS